jgi:hypothetical protein
MPYRNFLLSIHILGAVFIFGPTVAFALIGAQAKKEGAPVAWALALVDFIETKWVTPLAVTIQPLSGALLILQSKDLYNPFKSPGRWLLGAIILYIITLAFAVFVQTPNGKKAHHMAESGQFGPEFGALMKKLAMGGQLLTLALIGLVLLMVVKPGSGLIHI